MIKRLRSHLDKTKGFTLVELLVVIAIIAILVLLVIIAINPIQRIHDANDRTAEGNVRAVATAVEGCLTRNDEDFTACDTQGELQSATEPPVGAPWVRDWPDTTLVVDSGAGGEVRVCQPGGTGHRAVWTTTSGIVTHDDTSGAC